MNKFKGKMAEWINALVLKTNKVNSFQGSNPCLSKKISVSIFSIFENNIKNIILNITFCNVVNFHIDIMEFSYVENNGFSIFDIKIFKKILNIFNAKIEYHLMSKNVKNFNKLIKNSYIHIENTYFNKYKNIALSPNFCWKYSEKLFYKKIFMSVKPGFGNQKFIKKTLKKKSIFILDGGINLYIYKKIKNYFNKIIIGSKIINKKNNLSFFIFNFIINEYKN